MVENFDKIVKFFTKLNDYSILRQEKQHLIVETKVRISVYKMVETTFSNFESNLLQDFNVFFLISLSDKPMELDKVFAKRKLPILKLKLSDIKSLKNFNEALDKFIHKKFYS